MLKLSDIGDPNGETAMGFGLGLTHEKLNGRFFLIWYPPILMGFGRWFCGFHLELRWFLFHEQVNWDCPTDWLRNQQRKTSFSWGSGMKNVETSQGLRWTLPIQPIHLTKLASQASFFEKLPSSATYRSKRGIQRRHNMFPFIRRTKSPPYFLSLLLSQCISPQFLFTWQVPFPVEIYRFSGGVKPPKEWSASCPLGKRELGPGQGARPNLRQMGLSNGISPCYPEIFPHLPGEGSRFY